MFRSKHPYGPFVDQKTLFTLPEFLDKIGEQRYQHVYMVNIHPALSRTGELVISTNTDCSNFWDNFNAPGSADFYRPSTVYLIGNHCTITMLHLSNRIYYLWR